ncbi:PREDICTED: ataxin-2 homolog [Ceratosolen solmsi marchali]|uniref:Ataxin-2 homolog n=1 Tax=Ceratosolen solmsi marchali TaxID=326594 RepID=A0AAJ7DT40_9HYME|nr:PREDICTED: ataxin-2 homolog [Ceratosolen solmsi marchali]
MSEMTSVVEQQHQQQQYVGGAVATNDKLCCKDCGMNFDSSISLDVHLRYHQHNLLNQWATQTSQQEESNNNNSKAGNHNSGGTGTIKRESVTAPADSSETASRPASEGSAPPSSARLQHQHQEQGFNQHFVTPMFGDPQYFMHGEANYILPHHFSPDDEDDETAGTTRSGQSGNYTRYHPYHHPQHQHFAAERANSVSSTSPRSPLQCDKCGGVYEDAAQLAEHIRSNHSGSPSVYPPTAQSQYQQLAGSPQQQQQVTQSQQSQAQAQQQQMHVSSPQSQSNQQQQRHPQQQQQPTYDFVTVKNEVKQEPEEQAEILDLDSHKVQTHRYEEEFMRLHHQHQHQDMHVQMQHQVLQQHQARGTTHSVTSMLSWPPGSQPHDYHPVMSPMGPLDSVSPIQENQFMRGQQQHIPPVEPPRHPGSPIITSTQSMPSHPIPAGLMQQNPKPPPISGNQSWKSNEARRPKTYNCTACNKWFTSSGHLKRHYNTTLHKNAVKQSNQPDPANMPISAHHHPGREANSGRAGAASRNSPELSSSSSPPNLMAGPSGEATRGLLHTPTTTTTTTAIFNNNSSSNSSSEATPVQAVQKSLQHQSVRQQQQQQSQSQQSSTVMMVSDLVFLGSPASSPMAQTQHQQSQHQHQQMGSPSPQLGHHQHQQQQQHHHHHHHISTDSPSQIAPSGHHPMNSPISPMQQHPVHMGSPSPMASGHHHMSSPSPIMAGVVPASMASPPPGTMMGGTSMPHQPYPNALPPHVITITSIPGLLESITSQLTTTGNSGMHTMPTTNQQHQHQEMLPSFGTFSNHHQHQHQHEHQHKLMPSFSQFGCVANGFTGQDQSSVVNVGGLSPEEGIPQDRSFDSPVSNYDIYRTSPPRYECLGGIDMMQSTDGNIIVSTYSQLQQQQVASSQQQQQQQSPRETNNNLPHLTAKEDINPNIVTKRSDPKEEKSNSKIMTKEHQVTSTNTGSHYISVNGLHKCIECDKVFNKACYLTQHNKSFHSGDKPFKCNQCGKRFPHEYLHAEHLQKHAGDKPYKCEICPKQFNHKTDLRRHMCLHTGEKPYACDNCGKGFIRKDHMMKHLETHKKKSNNHHKLHLRA